MRTFLLALAMSVALRAAADDCPEFAYRDAAIPVAGATKVIIIGGAGFLHVRGRARTTEIRAGGKACAAIEELLVGIRLSTSRSGRIITVQASVPKQKAAPFAPEPHLDFTVTVPMGIDVEIADLSGEIKAERVHSVIVDTHSGRLSVSDLSGDFIVRKGRGAVDYKRVKGRVTIAR